MSQPATGVIPFDRRGRLRREVVKLKGISRPFGPGPSILSLPELRTSSGAARRTRAPLGGPVMARIRMRRHGRGERRGAVAVELAVVAPLLVFLLLIAVDFARIFYTSLTLANCARNGALFES